MRVCRRSCGSLAGFIFGLGLVLLLPRMGFGQASYTAQVRGVVADQSGALVANATVTITNDGTNISQTAQTDEHGQYFFFRDAAFGLHH